MRKKFLASTVSCLLVTSLFINTLFSFPQSVHASGIVIEAESAILMDVASGRILYEKNAYESRPQASTTKITTALLALEMGQLEDVVTVSKRAAETGEASIWLEEGEKHTLEDLLYAVMIRSGNDASVAVAEHIGGTVEDFAQLMNKRVKEIGAIGTNYVNPHGLHHKDHYSTAYDLAIITRHAMLYTELKSITSTKRRTMEWQSSEWDRVLNSRNKLLNRFEGADGVKTGYTRPAGSTFVGSATRDGRQLIAVVMKSPDIFAESEILLDYGFKNYESSPVIPERDIIKEWPVAKGKSSVVQIDFKSPLLMSLKKGEAEKIEVIYDLPKKIQAPIEKGQKLGKAEVNLEGERLVTLDIYAKEKVEGEIILSLTLWQRILGFFSNIFKLSGRAL